ncbi:MAG: osmoprotectant transport system permease protein [Frankiales bacterium]|nr:osmoprotectant transport system permease protein [Frankiales bacterium]
MALSSRGAEEFSNPWFSWSYITTHTHDILAATRSHVTLTLLAVAIGMAVAFPLALLGRRARWLRGGVLGLSNVLYSIPSLAAIVALEPIFHLEIWTVVLPLAAYSLVILVRNILTGLDEVPAESLEAARGMGLGPLRIFYGVELPLALPSILAGLRIATVSTIELVVIGGYIGQNGYGQPIFEGLHDNYRAEISTYVLLTVLLALVADLLILGGQRLLTPWRRART